jgi:hypothetical protein
MTDPNRPTRSVVLAYPLELDGVQHEPDQTVDLPADEAKQLVRDGRARFTTQDTAAGRTGTAAGRTGNEGGVTGG